MPKELAAKNANAIGMQLLFTPKRCCTALRVHKKASLRLAFFAGSARLSGVATRFDKGQRQLNTRQATLFAYQRQGHIKRR